MSFYDILLAKKLAGGGGVTPTGSLDITANGNYDVTQYAEADVNVQSSGGDAIRKDVNFFDYDGTILYSFTATEWGSVSTLPENPTHSGLTAQGWNYTKAQIDAEVQAIGKCDVGQMYITTSGDTELDIELYEGRLSPHVGICPNGTVEIDWGDGSAVDTVTGTSLTTNMDAVHTYTQSGAYTIKIHVVDGTFAIRGSQSSQRLLWGNGTTNEVYRCSLKHVRLGQSVGISEYAFIYNRCLESITIPNHVTNIGKIAFSNCYHLKHVTLPNSVTAIDVQVFYYAYGLESVSIPSSITSIPTSTFNSCYSLECIVIPTSITSIGNNVFQYCYALKDIILSNALTSLGGGVFPSCMSLESIKIPDSVTSMGNNSFSACYGLENVVFSNGMKTIPSNTFQDCYINRGIVFPSALETIGQSAFQNNQILTSVRLPSTITNIESYAFQSCKALRSIYVDAVTPPTIGSYTFDDIAQDYEIFVPSGSVDAYKTAWSTYADHIKAA